MASVVVLSWLSAVVAASGNLLVLISCWRDRSLREMHIYIVHLAFCDFMMGLVIIPLHASDGQWTLNAAACKTFYVLENFLEDMATFMVILLCMDRLALLKLGANYSTVETSRRARLKIFICVCASLLLNGPWLLLWSAVQDGNDVCGISFVMILPLEITLFVLDFLVPFFAITFVNIRIYLAIRQRLMIPRSSIDPVSYNRRLTTTTVPMSSLKKAKTGSKVLVVTTPDNSQSLTSGGIDKIFCPSSCCCEDAEGCSWCATQPQRVSLPRNLEASHTKSFQTVFSSLSKVSPGSASSSNTDRPSSTTIAHESKIEPSTHEQTTQKCQGQEKVSPVPQTSIYESPESMPTGSGRPVSVQGPPLLNDALEGEMATEAEKMERPSRGKLIRTKSVSQGSVITMRRMSVLQYFRFRTECQQAYQEQRRTLYSKENHAAQILIAIVLSMVVFWVPYRLIKLIKAACSECVTDSTFRFIEWVAWMRSCVNPMLYAANCPAFRTNFAQILGPFLYCLGLRFFSKK